MTDEETKKLKNALQLFQKAVKLADCIVKHIHWRQERFPKTEYDDATGLYKLATRDEVNGRGD